MTKRMVINVGNYGDFDMPNVQASLLAPENMSKQEIKEIIHQLKEEHYHTRDIERAIKALKQHGFVALQTHELLVGGGL